MDYLLYGAVDPTTTIISRAVDYIEERQGKVICFVDDDVSKQCDSSDVYYGGVHNREICRKYPNATIVILSSAVKEIYNSLREDGIDNTVLAYPLFRWWFPCEDISDVNRDAITWIEQYADDLKRIYEYGDIQTKTILDRILEQRKMMEFKFVDPEEMFGFHYKEYFFDEFLRPQGDLTVVDCGAYQGDSLKRQMELFGDQVKKAYAFEPDSQNFKIMQNLFRGDDRVTLVEAGVSDEKTVYRFAQNEMSGHFSDNGETEVHIEKIDDSIKEVRGKLCITMDVEGYEVNAINGASEIIKKYKPYIIACLYHKHKDIYDVPDAIRRIMPNYKFYLRAGTHTECYAVPF